MTTERANGFTPKRVRSAAKRSLLRSYVAYDSRTREMIQAEIEAIYPARRGRQQMPIDAIMLLTAVVAVARTTKEVQLRDDINNFLENRQLPYALIQAGFLLPVRGLITTTEQSTEIRLTKSDESKIETALNDGTVETAAKEVLSYFQTNDYAIVRVPVGTLDNTSPAAFTTYTVGAQVDLETDDIIEDDCAINKDKLTHPDVQLFVPSPEGIACIDKNSNLIGDFTIITDDKGFRSIKWTIGGSFPEKTTIAQQTRTIQFNKSNWLFCLFHFITPVGYMDSFKTYYNTKEYTDALDTVERIRFVQGILDKVLIQPRLPSGDPVVQPAQRVQTTSPRVTEVAAATPAPEAPQAGNNPTVNSAEQGSTRNTGPGRGSASGGRGGRGGRGNRDTRTNALNSGQIQNLIRNVLNEYGIRPVNRPNN